MKLDRTESLLASIVANPDMREIHHLASNLGDELPRGRLDILRGFRSLAARAAMALEKNRPDVSAILNVLNTVVSSYEARADRGYDWREPKKKSQLIEAWPETPDQAVYFLNELDPSAWPAILRLGDEALMFVGLSDARRYTDHELENALIGETSSDNICLMAAKPLGHVPAEIRIGRYTFPLVKIVGSGKGSYLDLVQTTNIGPHSLVNHRPIARPPLDQDLLPWP